MSSSKLIRSSSDRMIAGVCGGLGEYFSIDPTLFRLAFVLVAIFGGAGVFVYIILWIIVPETEDDSSTGEERLNKFGKEVEGYVQKVADEVKRGVEKNTGTSTDEKKKHMLLAVVLIIIGIVFIINNFLPNWNIWSLWPLFLIVFGVWLLWKAQPTATKEDGENKEKEEQEENKKEKDIGSKKEENK